MFLPEIFIDFEENTEQFKLKFLGPPQIGSSMKAAKTKAQLNYLKLNKDLSQI